MDENDPRMHNLCVGKFADKPGSYRLVVRSNKQLLNPGEDLWIQVLITGYGDIQAAKLVFYPDNESISGKESKVWLNMRKIGDKHYFGRDKIEVGEDGVTIDLGNGGLELFSDNLEDDPKGSPPRILTEMILRSPIDSIDAPVTIKLKLSKKARPGQHSLNFILTYYNGESWCSSETTFQFLVRNFYQRNEVKLWGLGICVALLTLLITLLSVLLPIFFDSLYSANP